MKRVAFWVMKRVQILLDEALDQAAAAEADRRGISKAALIRASLAKELESSLADREAAWTAITGWLDDGGVEAIDDAIYGSGAQSPPA
jgi:hypothetical protein